MKICPINWGALQCRTYVALDRNEKDEKEGWIWYEDLADRFVCECTKTNIDLQYIRKNLHALLGKKVIRENNTVNMNIEPLYEVGSLEVVRQKFIEILSSNPNEATLQRFIEENPILLHQFPAKKLIRKPPILNKYVGDFAIVTPQKELILIEIERSTIKLMKKGSGHRTAALNHAFEQVRDWLEVLDSHRVATLEMLGITDNEISTVRGVVIAGRDEAEDVSYLHRLKSNHGEKISFLTFDDLLHSFDVLLEKFKAI